MSKMSHLFFFDDDHASAMAQIDFFTERQIFPIRHHVQQRLHFISLRSQKHYFVFQRFGPT